MTVTPTPTLSVYALAGTNLGPFAVGFPYEQPSDVAVWVDMGAGAVLLAVGVGYTLAAADPLLAGGYLTLLAAALKGHATWPPGSTLAMRRQTEADQPLAESGFSAFDPVAYEAALDHVERQVQDIFGLVPNALRGGPGDEFAPLPPAAQRAGGLLGFDPVTGAPVVTVLTFGADGGALYFATTASAALAFIPTGSPALTTAGFTIAGDGGAALFAPVAGPGAGAFQSADGQWWAPGLQLARPEMVGVGRGMIAAGAGWLNAGRGGRLELLASEYDQAPFVLPHRVNLRGQGPADQPFYASTPKGTVISSMVLVGDAVAFEGDLGSKGEFGISDLSIYQAGVGSPKALLEIAGVLHPQVSNVELSGQGFYDGVGLLLDRDGLAEPTIYNDFIHLRISGVSVGIQIVDDCNASHFHGGYVEAGLYALHMYGIAAYPTGCGFYGTAFTATFNAGMDILWLPAGTNLIGYAPNTAGMYAAKLARIEKSQSTLFHGCSFTMAGLPGSYDDGVHGSLPIVGVVSIETGAVDVCLYGCAWSGCAVLDNGNGTEVNGLGGGLPDFRSKSMPRSVRATTTPTPIPGGTGAYTPIVFDIGDEEDTGFFSWNGGNTVCTINYPGQYRIDMTLSFDAMAGASAFNLAALLVGGVQRRGANVISTGVTVRGEVCCGVTWQGYLEAGQTITPQAQCSYGCLLAPSLPDNRLMITKVQ